jgi:hypothetical protein
MTLYGKISSKSFRSSFEDVIKDVTNALKRILRGIELLESLQKSMSSALLQIEEATKIIEMNLAKVCEELNLLIG